MKIPPELEALILATPGVLVNGRPVGSSVSFAEHTRAAPESEAEFQQRVIDLAHSLGYKVAHFRAVRIARANGQTYYATPVAADGEGFPDLILVGHGRIMAWELKVKPNKASEAQLEWIESFRQAAFDAAVYYPEDWERIVRVLKWSAPKK